MKVLLITHNPICTNNNMGKTFLSLFSEFEESELCQFYVFDSFPDVKVCHSYYRITDKEVLQSLFSSRTVGQEVSTMNVGVSQDASAISVQSKNSAMLRLARDLMWKWSCWYSENLKNWIKREAPTHIFLAPGYAKFIYDIAVRISTDYQIPIISYICDDYYFVLPPISTLGKYQLFLLKKKIKSLMKRTSHLVTICDEITATYCNSFQVPATTIMTGAEIIRSEPKIIKNASNSISYFGNLGCNRYRSLCDIGQVLLNINRQEGTSFTLKVYTSETDPAILKTLSQIPTIECCGFVTGEAFKRAMSETDLLIHVEAFDQYSVDLVKHSVSTKIADSLASGIPLLAYGPECIASIKHLMRNDCALIATVKDDLQAVLETALFQKQERERIVYNALQAASKYHNKRKNSAKLRAIFANLEGDMYERSAEKRI